MSPSTAEADMYNVHAEVNMDCSYMCASAARILFALTYFFSCDLFLPTCLTPEFTYPSILLISVDSSLTAHVRYTRLFTFP
jgi:hypothetical protein